MSARAAAVVVAVLAVAVAAPAARAESRLVLDQVRAEPSWFPGMAEVRAYVTAVTLEGAIVPVSGDHAWTLQLDASRPHIPYVVGLFGARHDEVAMAIVIETSYDYKDDLPRIKRAASLLVSKLPDSTQLTVIGYGATVNGGHRLSTAAAAQKSINDLEAEITPSDPKLVLAVKRAVHTLAHAKPSSPRMALRKIIVLVSDGHDEDFTPTRFRRLGEHAGRVGVRIDSLAYSPVDNRRPLLALGELSKRSLGTFRWVRDANGFSSYVRNILEEIDHQYVITFFAPKKLIRGARLRVRYRKVASNAVRVHKLGCGGKSCAAHQYCNAGVCVTRAETGGAGFLGWLFYIVGGLVALLALLVGVGFLLTRRQERQKARAAATLAAAAAQAQADPHRIVPQGPGGGPAQVASARATGAGPVAAPGGRQTGAQPVAPRTGAQPVAPRTGAQQVAGVRSGAHPAVAAAAVPTLLVLKGPQQGQRIALRHGFSVGKAKGCDYRIKDDPHVSGTHAHFVVDQAGGCTLVDDNSTNGTFVNGVRAAQMRLSHGMSIRFGSAEVRFLAQ